MTGRRAIQVIGIFFLCTICRAQTPDYEHYKTDLTSYLHQLNQYWNMDVKLQFPASGQVESKKNGIISIPITQLRRISKLSNYKSQQYLLKFTVCHEYAHQQQFDYYRDKYPKSCSQLYQQMLIETQADILGAALFCYLSPEMLDYFQTLSTSLDSVMTSAFSLVSDIGLKESTIGTHASKQDRWSAFLTGLPLGATMAEREKFKESIVNMPPLARGNEGMALLEYLARMYDHIGFDQTDSGFSWSMREAKKIINCNRELASNILYEHEEGNIKGNDTSTSEFIYNLKYLNVGEDTIEVEMDIILVYDYIQTPFNYLYHVPVNFKRHKFVIAPHSHQRVQGSIRWNRSENDISGISRISPGLLPYLIIPRPGEAESRYSCRKIHSYSEFVNLSQHSRLEKRDSLAPITLDNFVNAIRNVKLNPAVLRTGLGELLQNHERLYACIRQLNNHSNTYVVYNPDQSSYYTVTEIHDLTMTTVESKNIYSSLINQLKELYPQMKAVKQQIDTDQRFTLVGSDIIIRLLLTKVKYRWVDSYRIFLEVRPS